MIRRNFVFWICWVLGIINLLIGATVSANAFFAALFVMIYIGAQERD